VSAPSLLALDFDGVVCDGLEEYFESAWRTHGLLWGAPADVAPAGLAERFFSLRPLVESGWEMPLVVRALLAGLDDATIRREWPALAPMIRPFMPSRTSAPTPRKIPPAKQIMATRTLLVMIPEAIKGRS